MFSETLFSVCLSVRPIKAQEHYSIHPSGQGRQFDSWVDSVSPGNRIRHSVYWLVAGLSYGLIKRELCGVVHDVGWPGRDTDNTRHIRSSSMTRYSVSSTPHHVTTRRHNVFSRVVWRSSSIYTVVDEDVEGLRRSENTYTVLLCSSRSTVAVAVGWPPWNRNMNTNKRDMPWMVGRRGRAL